MSLPSYSADVSSDVPAPRLAQQLHAKTKSWHIAGRIAWWVMLLPAALALFSWARPAGWSRRIGLGVAAALALLAGIGAVADPPPEQPRVATLVAGAGQQSEDAGIARQAEQDKVAADAAAAQAAEDRKAAEASAAKAAADKAEADRIAADAAAAKAGAEKALAAQQAAAKKAAADKAAADKRAADTAAADKAAADRAAAQRAAAASAQQQQQSAAAPPAATSTTYANCTELRQDYPGGVALPGAVDKRSSGGHAQYQPTYSRALYEQNSGKDRDGDGIACEA